MPSKRTLAAEIVRLSYRVAELEEKLCPCEGHAWKKIGADFYPDVYGGGDTRYTYKCRTCGKVVTTYMPFMDAGGVTQDEKRHENETR